MGDTANESLAQRNLVDINVATVEELSTLVGVGRSRAEAIVETRNVSLGLPNISVFYMVLTCLFLLL
jgi:hypothetical protein